MSHEIFLNTNTPYHHYFYCFVNRAVPKLLMVEGTKWGTTLIKIFVFDLFIKINKILDSLIRNYCLTYFKSEFAGNVKLCVFVFWWICLLKNSCMHFRVLVKKVNIFVKNNFVYVFSCIFVKSLKIKKKLNCKRQFKLKIWIIIIFDNDL